MGKRSWFRRMVRGQGVIQYIVLVFFLVMGVLLLYLTLDVLCSFGATPCCAVVNAINALLGLPPNPDGGQMCPGGISWRSPAGFSFWQ